MSSLTGPLATQLGNIPFRCATVAVVTDTSQGGRKDFIGTATLLQLGVRKLAVTCDHVLRKLDEYRAGQRRAMFQIGSVRLDPTNQLVDCDASTDFATIELSLSQARVLEEDGKVFHVPPNWPAGPVNERDWAALGGFPGENRVRNSLFSMVSGFFPLGSTPITEVSDSNIVCSFERSR